MTTSKKMQLVGVVQRTVSGGEPRNFWTKIGIAFENSDGSWNLRFDYLPTGNSETTIQLRPFDPKDPAKSE
jgi:hypothetical protein